MEPGSVGRELDENRHRAVRLRRRLREKPVGDLALHHHRPVTNGGQSVEALNDQRGGDVVREVRDELRRLRVEAAEVEPERVAEVESDVCTVAERLMEE